jgi:hypothetical protein
LTSVGRARGRYAALAAVTIAAGLAVHFAAGRAPTPAWRDVLGDALWAAMIEWWMGVVAPRAHPAVRALAALAICFAVELSQLVHAPWLDALRASVLGRLVLGSGFEPRDLAAYAAGVLVAALVSRFVVALPALTRQRRERESS